MMEHDHSSTMPRGPRSAGLESAGSGGPRRRRDYDDPPARERIAASARYTLSGSQRFRSGRRRVHRRKRWRRRGAATEAEQEILEPPTQPVAAMKQGAVVGRSPAAVSSASSLSFAGPMSGQISRQLGCGRALRPDANVRRNQYLIRSRAHEPLAMCALHRRQPRLCTRS